MIFNEYVEEVMKYYLTHFSNEQYDSAKKYFNSKEAQDIIKERYSYYTSKDDMLKGGSQPEAVANCLSLMW